MYKGYAIYAVIPARGGSKGIPKKNIRVLNGKPLLAWSIECTRECGFFDAVFVSTDSDEIAHVAMKHNALVLTRPPELATDTASGNDVFFDAVEKVEQKYGKTPSFFLYLQPTSPLRSPEDIRKALDIAIDKDADVVISVCECEHHPLLCNTLPEDLSMAGFLKPEIAGKNRQELPRCYRINGAIYILRSCESYVSKSLFSGKVHASIMPQERSIDIDSPLDFKMAEFLMMNNI